jgi:EpsI family protein
VKIQKTVKFSAILSCFVLLAAGYAYRKAAVRLDALVKEPLLPTIPLSVLPYQIGQWKGEDQPLGEAVLEVAGNDDYINRVYHLADSEYYVNLYVAFTGQPRSMRRHRPEVCYVGAGWILEQTEEQEIQLESGQHLPVQIHYFRKPPPEILRLMVLNYYIVNGNVTRDHHAFSGILWRVPTFSRKQIRYVAQVQVSSVSSTALMSFIPEAAPLILPFMPVQNDHEN